MPKRSLPAAFAALLFLYGTGSLGARPQANPEASNPEASNPEAAQAAQRKTESIQIGDSKLVIPWPSGYEAAVGDLANIATELARTLPKDQELLRLFVNAEDAARVRKGEPPILLSYKSVQAIKSVRGRPIGRAEFTKLRKAIREDNDRIWQQARKKLAEKPEGDDTEAINQLVTRMELGDLLPEKPHFESEDAISFGVYMTLSLAGETGQGGTKDEIPEENKFRLFSASSLVIPAGKLITLNTRGPAESAELVRKTNGIWRDAVLKQNPAPPESAGGWGNNFMVRILIYALIGALAGGLVTFFRRKRVAKASGSED
jgi:hypothetical protein